MKKLILITLVFILAACSAGGSELSRNKQTWEGANIFHYRFELSITCFCAFRDQMPLTVEVQNGEIISMVATDGSAIAIDNDLYATFAQHATVERLFSDVESAVKDGADTVTVTYDSMYGFPADVQIDYSQNIADEELYLNASNFEALR